jgi:hypothetical protein
MNGGRLKCEREICRIMGRKVTIITPEKVMAVAKVRKPEKTSEQQQLEFFQTKESSPMRIFAETHRGKESHANG